MNHLLRNLPSVDACLGALGLDAPHVLARDLVRRFLDERRREVREGRITQAEELRLEALLPSIREAIRHGSRPALRRVLNATGVVVHTNLGRSVLAPEALEAVAQAGGHYCNLEFDLEHGRRGSRHHLVRDVLCQLTGAEDALVVNNNAAAVLIMLDTLARDREVVVSRGELVEIGGSFRIPEVMARSGAFLREVGSTNRTHLQDFEEAIGETTAALMSVHTSNYSVVGFHTAVPRSELCALAHGHGLPCLVDLGSGSLVDFTPWGLGGEPVVEDCIREGADIVSFSGDKVLGGPQAGILVGKSESIRRIAQNQLLRALRPDKLTLAALEATLRLYLEPEAALAKIPTLRAMTLSSDELLRQARNLARHIRRRLKDVCQATVTVTSGVSRVGGGSFPEKDLPTSLVRLTITGISPDTLRRRLLDSDPPLVIRVEDEAVVLDPRTLSPADIPLVAALLGIAAEGTPRPGETL